jgi:hypothetical protein
VTPGPHHIDVIATSTTSWSVTASGGDGDASFPQLLPLISSQASSETPNGASVLIQTSGTGDRETGIFTTPTGSLQICWSVSGATPDAFLGPDASLGPYVAFSVDSLLGSQSIGSFEVNTVDQDCSDVIGDPGAYYVTVIATTWSDWTVTVRPG